MPERRITNRIRTLRGGKIVFNHKSSVVECTVRNVSPSGAGLEVQSPVGIPDTFELVLEDGTSRYCTVQWRSGKRIGVAYAEADAAGIDGTAAAAPGNLAGLCSALDEVDFGVVLLDTEMRAQFINRTFRRMWRLPAATADSKPPFVALLYHGRDTRAYDVPVAELDAYVAARVEAVKAGDPTPRDLVLASGEVLRFQCAVLPDGGRMLSYTYVTDIKRSASEADQLRAAFDALEAGIILLDSGLRAVLVNRAARQLWNISDEQAGRHPAYTEFVHRAFTASGMAGKPRLLEGETATHLARALAGDPTPMTLSLSNGEMVQARCTALPDGGRLLAYERIAPQEERVAQRA